MISVYSRHDIRNIPYNLKLVPDIVGDIVFFLHDIGDFPILRPSRKGKSEISGPISGILYRYQDEKPDIAPVKKG